MIVLKPLDESLVSFEGIWDVDIEERLGCVEDKAIPPLDGGVEERLVFFGVDEEATSGNM